MPLFRRIERFITPSWEKDKERCEVSRRFKPTVILRYENRSPLRLPSSFIHRFLSSQKILLPSKINIFTHLELYYSLVFREEIKLLA